jgi:hypothetical protein
VALAACGSQRDHEDHDNSASNMEIEGERFHVLDVEFSTEHDPHKELEVRESLDLYCDLEYPKPVKYKNELYESAGESERVKNKSGKISFELTDLEIQDGSYELKCFVQNWLHSILIAIFTQQADPSVMKMYTPYYYEGVVTIEKGRVEKIRLTDDEFYRK